MAQSTAAIDEPDDGPDLIMPKTIPIKSLSRVQIRAYHNGSPQLAFWENSVDYSREELESNEDIELNIRELGQYSIDNSPHEPLVINTLPLYFDGDVGTDQAVPALLRFVSLSSNELPVYHYFEGYSPAPFPEFKKPVAQEQPETEGELIDRLFEMRESQIVVNAAKDPENNIRHQPCIGINDPAWNAAVGYFTSLLQSMKKNNGRLLDIINQEFEESQRLLLLPAIQKSELSRVQQDNKKLYASALQKAFKDAADNTVTKMTMLRFGLPVAPLTKVNALHAGTDEDLPASRDADHDDFSFVDTIVRGKKHLSFLDSYHTRSYGYPLIRNRKRHSFDNEETDPTKTKRTAPAPWDAQNRWYIRRACGTGKIRRDRGDKLKVLQFNTSLRGGADPADDNDAVPVVYATIGQFGLRDNDKKFPLNFAFRKLSFRLFRSVYILKPGDTKHIELDIFGPNGLITSTKTTQETGAVDMEAWMQKNVTTREKSTEKFVRIRPFGFGKDDLPRPNIDDKDVVELENEETQDVAYWYLPILDDASIPIVGVNKQYETLENALECIFPGHHSCDIDWNIGEDFKGTKLGDSPADDLLRAAFGCVAAKKTVPQDNKPLRIVLREVSREQESQLKLVVPGNARTATPLTVARAAFSTDAAEIIFQIFSKLIQDEFKGDKDGHYEDLRVFQDLGALMTSDGINVNLDSSVSYESEYAAGSFQLTAQEPNNRSYYLRPHFRSLNIVGERPDQLIEGWGLDDDRSLKSFRGAIRRLWKDWNPGRDSFTIIDPHPRLGKQNQFLIEPEMDEARWRLQVYLWLRSPNIHVARSDAQPLRYSIPEIRGPLWTTISAEKQPPRTGWDGDVPPEETQKSAIESLKTHIEGQGGAFLPLNPIIDVGQGVTQTGGPSGSSLTQEISARDLGYQFEFASSGDISQSWPRGLFKSQKAPSNQISERFPQGVVRSNAPLSSETWKGYMERQEKADDNRQLAYTQSQAISGPSGMQHIILGIQKGNSIRGGSQVPSSIVTTKSRKQIQDAEIFVRNLSNTILEREKLCQLCGTAFSATIRGLDELKAHLRSHNLELASNVCPYCQPEEINLDYDWRLWTRTERIAHLETAHGIGAGVRTIPAATQTAVKFSIPCPFSGCNRWLGRNYLIGTNIEIIDHLSDHVTKGEEPIANGSGRDGLTPQWCEYCGRKRFLSDDNHACLNDPDSKRAKDSQYCPSCGLGFWDRGFSDEDMEAHLTNEILQHDISPRNLFFTLFRRILPSTMNQNNRLLCHFKGCGRDITITEMTERNKHYRDHIINNDVESRPCHVADCIEDLSSLNPGAVLNHYATHLPGSETNRKNCSICNTDITQMSTEETRQHYKGHLHTLSHSAPAPMNDDRFCRYPMPKGPCEENLKGMSNEEVETRFRNHLPCEMCSKAGHEMTAPGQRVNHIDRIHRAEDRRKCPFADCGYQFSTRDDDNVYFDHFQTHLPERSPPPEVEEPEPINNRGYCNFPGCDVRFDPDTNEDTYRIHFQTHAPQTALPPTPQLINDRTYCNFPRCDHRFDLEASEKDYLEHFKTHSDAPASAPASVPVPSPSSSSSRSPTRSPSPPPGPEFPDDIIKNFDVEIRMPERKLAEAVEEKKQWHCPHCLNKAIRRGKSPMILAVHFQEDHQRVTAHNQWRLLNNEEQTVAKQRREQRKRRARARFGTRGPRTPRTTGTALPDAPTSPALTRSAKRKLALDYGEDGSPAKR